ncbi:MAG: dephospho-CoA kinase [Bacteroidia bacterium]|nr:dephospho-CoA kinase [Bacteroidia bacterium]
MTGGIGVGKSYILQKIQMQGYPIYMADSRAKVLMQEDPFLREGIIALLGPEAYLPDGTLNRSYIAERIFREPFLREKLNALVHPRTIQDFLAWVSAQKAKGCTVIFKEAALTLEAGAYHGLTHLVVVYAPVKVRIERLCQRDGLSPTAALARIQGQWPEWKKIAYADFLIVNDGHLPIEPQLENLLAHFQPHPSP